MIIRLVSSMLMAGSINTNPQPDNTCSDCQNISLTSRPLGFVLVTCYSLNLVSASVVLFEQFEQLNCRLQLRPGSSRPGSSFWLFLQYVKKDDILHPHLRVEISHLAFSDKGKKTKRTYMCVKSSGSWELGKSRPNRTLLSHFNIRKTKSYNFNMWFWYNTLGSFLVPRKLHCAEVLLVWREETGDLCVYGESDPLQSKPHRRYHETIHIEV